MLLSAFLLEHTQTQKNSKWCSSGVVNAKKHWI